MLRTICYLLGGLLLAGELAANENRSPFEPAASVTKNLLQHQRLPDPAQEVWWTPTGEDMRWNNLNLHQLFPTVNVYRDGAVKPLPYALNESIGNYLVDTPDGGMPFTQFLHSDQSTSMAVVVVHQGRIVFEEYPRMQEFEKPIWWSVTKVFASTLIAILEDRGQIDVDQPVEKYLPELASSDFKGVTVRNVLDMASGVDCPDGDYAPGTCYYEFEASLGDAVFSEQSHDTPYEALAAMKPGKWAEQGVGFDYSGTNTFVLSWIVERLMEMPFQDAVSKEIWMKLGAEGDASFFAGRNGVALSTGGFLAKARDMARFGMLFTPSWQQLSDEPIISDKYLSSILNGRSSLFSNARYGDGTIPDGMSHNAYQWDVIYSNGDIFKGGWAGQGLLINPEKDLVAVYLGYSKDDAASELSVQQRLRAALDALYPSGAARQAM
jgi:CubicO group peptidase (beta-lactamase class C family)